MITKELALQFLEELKTKAEYAFYLAENHSHSCSKEFYDTLEEERCDMLYKASQLEEYIESL